MFMYVIYGNISIIFQVLTCYGHFQRFFFSITNYFVQISLPNDYFLEHLQRVSLYSG